MLPGMTTRLHGKVLGIVGDEHLVGAFGRALVPLLRGAGALVVEDGRAGRTAADLLVMQGEPMRPTSGLGRSGPMVMPTVLGAKPDVLIFVLKADTELEHLKSMAKASGVSEVWIANPTSANPAHEAALIVAKLTGAPPPPAPAPTLGATRPVRERV